MPIDKALEFLNIEKPIVGAAGVNQDLIINMDQTPVFLSMHPKQTLELCGAVAVNRRKTCNSTNQVTVLLAASASGKKLKPMLIFKGTLTGQIATRELPTFPEG